jgi:2-iminobutanoate/2-iminopropanoate deaminase
VQPDPKEARMTGHVITTQDAPQSPLYAQGVRAGSHVWVSGMTGVDPATGQLAGPTIEEQVRQALTNCVHVVEAGGGSLDDVVEVGVLLARPDDFAGLNEAYAEFFPDAPPARYVARLGPELPGVLVSVRMAAVVG